MTFQSNLLSFLYGPGPQGQPPPQPPAPTTSEWVAQRAWVLSMFHHIEQWRLGHGEQPNGAGTEPFDTLNAGWGVIPPEDLIRDAHIATYP